MSELWALIMLTERENGSQKGITGRKYVSQNRLPDRNLALKGITGREFGSKNHLPDENLAMTGQKCIFLFFVASCQIFHI